MSKNLERLILKELDRQQMKGYEIANILKSLNSNEKAESFYYYLTHNKSAKLTGIEIYKTLKEI